MASAALPELDSSDYDAIKAAVLVWYDINEDAYRNRFMSSKRKEGERNREFVVWISDGLVDQVAQGVQDGRPDSSSFGDRAVPDLAPSGEKSVAGGAEVKDAPSGW